MQVRVVVAWLLLSIFAFAQRSALTVSRNLAQLTQQAATIVRARVVSVQVEPHPQLTSLTTVVVKLQVLEALKGSPQSVFTFRQFVWDLSDRYEASGYRKGQELLLLLNPVSPYGLTSPVGMEQGRFRISRDAQGNVFAVNGHENVGLFANLSAQAQQRAVTLSPRALTLAAQHRSGPVPLPQLEEIIRQFAGGAK